MPPWPTATIVVPKAMSLDRNATLVALLAALAWFGDPVLAAAVSWASTLGPGAGIAQ
jgi:hypothetical protein